MDFIYTDSNYIEQGYFKKCELDIEIGKYSVSTNDFKLTIPSMYRDSKFAEDSLFYCENTEFGGIVQQIGVDTSTNKLMFKGKTFRGLLEKEVIQPPSNQAYYVANGDANLVINNAIKDKFDDLFVVDGINESGIIVNYQTRDINLLQFLEKALYFADVSSKLNISFYDGKVHLKAVKINDISQEMQYDNSYGLTMQAETASKNYNHIIALGAGELTERLRVNLYLKSDGTWTTDSSLSPYTGLKRITYLYEDTNQDDITELTDNAIEKISEVNGTQTLTINFTSDDAELFDIVGAKEEITGISFKEQITKKILRATLNDNIQSVKIEYKVGD